MKRFVETNRWRDPWFRRLSPTAKLLWSYLTDNCDCVGVIDLDLESAVFHIGTPIDEKHLTELSDRIERTIDGKLFIPTFIRFQYGKLSRECKPHIPIFAALERHGINLDDVLQSNQIGKNGVPEYLREKVIERDGFVCAYTGKELLPSETVIDHVIPKAAGGRDSLDNLVVADRSINGRKGSLAVEEFCKNEGLDYESIRKTLCQRLSKGYPKPLGKGKGKGIGKTGESEGGLAEPPEMFVIAPDSPKITAEEIYAAYPLKKERPVALVAIKEAMKRHAPEMILERTRAYAEARGGNVDFVPYPAKWFKREGFLDDPATWRPSAPAERTNEPRRQMSAFEINQRLTAINQAIDRLFLADKVANRERINALKADRQTLKDALAKA